jgi:hypothetical protein
MNEFYGVGIHDTLHGVLVHFGSFNDHPHHGKKLTFVSNSNVGKLTFPLNFFSIDLLLRNHPKT